MPPLSFQITARDPASAARSGVVTTPHGSFDTPAFMPVGTRATIKGLLPDQVASLGAQIILANTYHLLLRPGPELVAQMQGLHHWMRWPRPILTDSGGFQVFSLASINHIDDQGVTFKSHIDGQTIHLTPQRSIQTQNALGADIIMAFDDCPPALATSSNAPTPDPKPQTQDPARNRSAAHRTIRWLELCIHAHARKHDQALFPIVQGGTDLELRSWCASQVLQHDLPGYAIGGVAVGERPDLIKQVVVHTATLLPENKPRYLMGVGYEHDILMAVHAGIDMFDCVLPTRNGRNAYAFTSQGQLRLRNARYSLDPQTIEPGCDCPACSQGFSRSYLRHLFMVGEMTGPILVSAHNIRHFQRYLLDIRHAIADNDWSCIDRNWPVATRPNNAPA